MDVKRKLLGSILAAAALTLAACGNTKESEEAGEAKEAVYLKDIAVEDYVTLGQFEGLEIDLEEPEVTEEYLESYIQFMLANNPVYTLVTDRAVEMGDVVNIDYEGKLDGVAFERGAAQGADLEIGSGSFIEGFEDGCIGMEIGETRDVEAHFPDPYSSNPDLAGKTAVFTVTVNSISVPQTPVLSDEYVAGLGIEDCESVEDYREFIHDILMEQQRTSFENDKMNLVVERAAENSQVKDAPAGMVERMRSTLLANITSYANMYGMEIGEFVAAEYGGEAEDYEKTLQTLSETMAKRYLLMQAIALEKELEVSDGELDEELAAEAVSYGYESAEEYREAIDVEAFREYLMTQKVIEFLAGSAVVKTQ